MTLYKGLPALRALAPSNKPTRGAVIALHQAATRKRRLKANSANKINDKILHYPSNTEYFDVTAPELLRHACIDGVAMSVGTVHWGSAARWNGAAREFYPTETS